MNKFNKELAVKLLAENVLWEIGGWENEVQDGNMTKEELAENMDIVNLANLADYYLNEAFKKGYLTTPQSKNVLEAKHLKFLGSDELTVIKGMAAGKALALA